MPDQNPDKTLVTLLSSIEQLLKDIIEQQEEIIEKLSNFSPYQGYRDN